MANGKVKRLVTDRGFGFIQGDDGKDYFFHHSAVVTKNFDQMKPDDEVEFEPTKGEKGPRAEQVRTL